MGSAKRQSPGKVAPRAVRAGGKKLARRRYQKGQVLLLGSKTEPRWFGRWYEDVAENGETRRQRVQVLLGTQKELPTESLALRELEKRLRPINDPNYHVRPTTTFEDFAEEWIKRCEARKRKPIKPSTLVNWKSILENHINDVLGRYALPDVGNRAMKELVEVLVEKGLSAQTIKNVTQVVKLAMASAVDEDGEELYPRKWNHDFIDMPVVEKEKQHAPSFTGEQVSKIVAAASGKTRMLLVLLAATGMRAGEVLGLEVRHFDGKAVRVEQEVWRERRQEPKTPNAKRTIDLCPKVGDLLKQFLGERTDGFIFQTRSGKPISQTNILKRELYPILEDLDITKRGFHSFRRFRNTFLRNYTACPDGLLKFWMGHANKDMSDRYDKVREDVQFRRDVAGSVGVGFELPESVESPNSGRVPDANLEHVNAKSTKTLEKVGVSDGI